MSANLKRDMALHSFTSDSSLFQRSEVFNAIVNYNANTGGRISKHLDSLESEEKTLFFKKMLSDVLEHFILLKDIEDSVKKKTPILLCDNMRESVVQFSFAQNLKRSSA